MALWIIETTLMAGLLALLAVGISRRWASHPGVCHLAWLVVVLRLLVPPGVVAWPWSVTQPWRSTTLAPGEFATDDNVATTPTVPSNDQAWAPSGHAAPLLPEREATTKDSPEAISTAPKSVFVPDLVHTIQGLIFVGWLGGSLVTLGRRCREWWSIRRVVDLAETADLSVRRQIDRWSRRMGLPSPAVKIVPGLPSPLVVGLFRPILLWPKELHARLDDEGYQAVVIHELAHLRRRDHWVRWFEMVAGVFWWWNPLFRIARRRLRHYSEMACDAWVLRVLPKARQAYAAALLQVCETLTQRSQPAPALGIGGGLHDLKQRLTLIMATGVPPHTPSYVWALGLLIALISVPSWAAREAASPAEVDLDLTPQQLALSLDAHQALAEIHRSTRSHSPDESPTTHAKAFLTNLRRLEISPGLGDVSSTVHYRMAPDLARTLARLLRRLAAPDRLTAIAEGDQLIVTTRAEDQPIVTRLIQSIASSPPDGSSR